MVIGHEQWPQININIPILIQIYSSGVVYSNLMIFNSQELNLL